jgi:hypothetical protein
MKFNKTFSQEFIKATSIDAKIGLFVTVNDNNFPHITLITSLTANKKNELS